MKIEYARSLKYFTVALWISTRTTVITEKFIFGNPMTPGISKAVVLLGNMANKRSWK